MMASMMARARHGHADGPLGVRHAVILGLHGGCWTTRAAVGDVGQAVVVVQQLLAAALG